MSDKSVQETAYISRETEQPPAGEPDGLDELDKPGGPDRETDGEFDAELERLMSRYVFDDETGMVYEIGEAPAKPFAPIAAGVLCAVLLGAALISGLLSGAKLRPEDAYRSGESILSESAYREEQERQQIGQHQEQQQEEAVVYVPASIIVEGEAVATLASAEAAYSLLEEVKAHFDGMVEGEGERATQFMEEPAVVEYPDALPEEIESFDQAFERFTSGRSPVRVMTTLTVTTVEELPYDTEEEDDEELMEGTSIIVSQGRAGSETEIIRSVYVNGDRSSSRSSRDRQEIAPQDRVIRRGEQEYDEDDSPGRREGREGPDAGDFGLAFAEPIEGDIELNFGQSAGVLHLGLDYGDIEDGAMVTASCAGVVVCAMERGGYGLMVEIDHGGGFVTRYARLGSIQVELGDRVEQGQPIGEPGVPEGEEEPRLHFEIRVDGEAYNPRYYLD